MSGTLASALGFSGSFPRFLNLRPRASSIHPLDRGTPSPGLPGFAFDARDQPLPCTGDSTSGPGPPHREFGSPPPRSRASRHCRACGCRAPAARCTAATPSASTRLGSAPRRNSSSTALRSGCQGGPQPPPRAPALTSRAPPSPWLLLPQRGPQPSRQSRSRAHDRAVLQPRCSACQFQTSRFALVRTRHPTSRLGSLHSLAALGP